MVYFSSLYELHLNKGFLNFFFCDVLQDFNSNIYLSYGKQYKIDLSSEFTSSILTACCICGKKVVHLWTPQRR